MRKLVLLGALLCMGAGAIAVSKPKPKPIVLADGGGPVPECIPGDPKCPPPTGGGGN